ncbi:MAG: flagellar biosynthesis protein FlhF [Gammaproteobacteria bacterium]|nr:flagellar biosynthesis protein FlhF [Gammaproteobacteria bacterium]MCW8911676.1 flagellar biosynthesis protein FlhF [Gammaproteobacteria bacterium]MCW9003934.1 flagellar biosynthesis protein FlhF [Gammaproteobacteria bacterium]MCW9056922.1 flagellar biosynthesis protein FlhF [Gammaproteobacteria bacterium]
MKVKRFIAKDMRTALRQVKEDMGPDAVILSNRKVGDQTEILVADDYDEQLINQALDQTMSQNHSSAASVYNSETYSRQSHQSVDASLSLADTEMSGQNSTDDLPKSSELNKKFQVTDVYSDSLPEEKHQAAGLFHNPVVDNSDITAMHDELKSLKAMIENQQALSEWGQLSQKHPLRVTLYKRLTEMGLSQDVCKYLVKGLDQNQDVEHSMQAALKQLVHQLTVVDDDILNRGGVYAMVGPTGVGKTTTIAKLAARFAMRHGQKHVALISTDNYRIGAHEQLMTYGRLLGVPVHTVNNAQELQQLLHTLYDKKLVLIDTAGMSQRDVRLSEQFVHFSSQQSLIKSYLVLSANAQLPTLNEVVRSFKKANLAGCILTKVDEAASLGGVLSIMIKHHLPAAYISNGQRVPEDLQPARARDLVDDMIKHAKNHRQRTDDDFMAVAFTSGVGHAHL